MRFHEVRSTLRRGRALLPAALAAGVPGPLAAHPGRPVAPHDLWGAWSWEPGVLISLFVAAWIYSRGVEAVWRRAGAGRGVARAQALAFGGGIAALLVALVSPLDAAGGALFTAHMLQHLLLMAVAAPLLVLGAPQVGLAWGLPRRGRAAAARWWHALGLRALFRGLAHPLAAFALHAGALWAWHLPGAYDAALAHEGVHALEHASFLGTAALFWWVALHPAGRLRRSPGAAVLYAFAMAMASGALGALLAFSEAPWYAAHLQSAAAWGLTPAADQQLAGLVMWIPGGVPYLAAAVWLLLQWLRASERRVRAAEARRALAA